MNNKKIFIRILIGVQAFCFMIAPGYCEQNEENNLPKIIRSTNSANGYTFDAEVLSFDELMKEVEDAQIVYVGEFHSSVPDKEFFLQIIEQTNESSLLIELVPSVYQYILDKFNSGNINSLEELNKQSRVGSSFLKRYKDICLTARQNQINVYGVDLVIVKSANDYEEVDIFDIPSFIDIVGMYDPRRDKYMAAKVIELEAKKKKNLFYAGNAHLVNIPKIVSRNGTFKQIIIHQAALFLIDGYFYIDQLFDEILAKTGLDYLILRIGKDEYFVINHIPEDADRLTRKEFDRLVKREINESRNENLFKIKAELDELLDQLNGGHVPIRKILKLYRELSLPLKPDMQALLKE